MNTSELYQKLISFFSFTKKIVDLFHYLLNLYESLPGWLKGLVLIILFGLTVTVLSLLVFSIEYLFLFFKFFVKFFYLKPVKFLLRKISKLFHFFIYVTPHNSANESEKKELFALRMQVAKLKKQKEGKKK